MHRSEPICSSDAGTGRRPVPVQLPVSGTSTTGTVVPVELLEHCRLVFGTMPLPTRHVKSRVLFCADEEPITLLTIARVLPRRC